MVWSADEIIGKKAALSNNDSCAECVQFGRFVGSTPFSSRGVSEVVFNILRDGCMAIGVTLISNP